MKMAIALFLTIASSSAFAGETLCFQAKLKDSYPAKLNCEEEIQVCVNGYERINDPAADDQTKSTSLVLKDKNARSVKMIFTDEEVENDCDINAHILQNFKNEKLDINAELEIETSDIDYESHGNITGTFINMNLWRVAEVKKDSFQYQSCNYTLSK